MAAIKQTHRALFLALQADAKQFPGGIKGLAEIIGCNGNTLANCMNPDHDAPPPSFSNVVEVVELAQARRMVFVLAQMVGQVPIDMEVEPRSPREAMSMFMLLLNEISQVIGTGSEAARDGIFDTEERKSMEPLLNAVIKSAFEFKTAIRG